MTYRRSIAVAFATIVQALAFFPSLASAQDGLWLTRPAAPSARFRQASSLDPLRGRMIVFGGAGFDSAGTSIVLGDLWASSLGDPPTWSPLASSGAPPAPRCGAAMAYDPVRDRMILFSGSPDAGLGTSLNDVWELDLSGAPEWRPLAPAGTAPSVYTGALMLYDSRRDRMIVQGEFQNPETWELSLSDPPAWRRMNPAGGPLPFSRDAAGIYDPVRDRIVVYGGHSAGGSSSTRPSALTFGAGDGTWTRITPSTLTPWPEYREGVRAVYDPVRDRMVVQGGLAWGDTWALSLGSSAAWTALSASSGDRVGYHALCYDPAYDRLVSFGGKAPSTAGDPHDLTRTLALADGRWSISALPRYEQAIAVDTRRARVLVFGGMDADQPARDTWERPLAPGGWWTQIVPPGSWPRARSRASAAYDSLGDRLLLFGGAAPESLNDVWELSLAPAPAWHLLSPAGAPPGPRSGHSAVVDPARQRMIVYGGASGRHEFPTTNQTWALDWSNGLQWSPLAPGGVTAPATVGHAALLDAASDRMLAFIAGGPSYALTFDPLAWAPLGSQTSPFPWYQGHLSGFLDPAGRRVALAGDGSSGGAAFWSYDIDGDAWRLLALEGGAPSARLEGTLVADPATSFGLLTGGGHANGTAAEPREFTWRTDVAVREPHPIAAALRPRIHPSPGRDLQWIDLELPANGGPAQLAILDVSGRCIRSWRLAGAGPVRRGWDARDDAGQAVSPGVYFARVTNAGGAWTARLVRVR